MNGIQTLKKRPTDLLMKIETVKSANTIERSSMPLCRD